MEQTVNHLIELLVTGFFIVFMIVVGGLLYHNNLLNSYQAQTVQVLQRTGGLNEKASSKLNNISKQHYFGFFSVTTEDNQKVGKTVGFGKPINYRIHSSIPVGYGKTQVTDVKYHTTSMVRKDSQI